MHGGACCLFYCVLPLTQRLFQLTRWQNCNSFRHGERIAEGFGSSSHFRDTFQGEIEVFVSECLSWRGKGWLTRTGIDVHVSCSCFLTNILRASLSLWGPSAFYRPLFGLLNLVCMVPTARRHPSGRDRVRPAWVYCVKFRLEIHGNEFFERLASVLPEKKKKKIISHVQFS